tara:strand:- start:3113 stop:3616 length:504 start_codon:yes stop_codon:yes gene_type:complete
MEVLKKEVYKQETKTPKSLKEAINEFQSMNVKAIKDAKNTHFKSSYADLTSVIDAVNEGASLGLSFTQVVKYENLILKRAKTENGSVVEHQELHRDIFVHTIVRHINDNNTLECTVPVLINGNDKDNPQKMGSAITYAKRYGLQSLYGLASDDDANEASKKEISNGR